MRLDPNDHLCMCPMHGAWSVIDVKIPHCETHWEALGTKERERTRLLQFSLYVHV